MKQYELIASSYSVVEATLGSDSPGLTPLRVVAITAKGILVANQAEASFTIAIGSEDAISLANAIIEYSKGVPSPQDQTKGIK